MPINSPCWAPHNNYYLMLVTKYCLSIKIFPFVLCNKYIYVIHVLTL